MYCNKCGAALENDNQEKCTLCGSDLVWVGKSEAPIHRMPMIGQSKLIGLYIHRI